MYIRTPARKYAMSYDALMDRVSETSVANYLTFHASSGDLLLFQGESCVSCGIRSCGSTQFTHTAVVICDTNAAAPRPRHSPNKELYQIGIGVLESNPNDGTILGFQYGNRDGPQMSSATTRLNNYDGTVFVRRLRQIRSSTHDASIVNTHLLEYLVDCKRRRVRYCKRLSYWSRTFFRVNVRDCEEKRLYCVNFAARALCKAGIIAADTSVNNLSLHDMASGLQPMSLFFFDDMLMRLQPDDDED